MRWLLIDLAILGVVALGVARAGLQLPQLVHLRTVHEMNWATGELRTEELWWPGGWSSTGDLDSMFYKRFFRTEPTPDWREVKDSNEEALAHGLADVLRGGNFCWDPAHTALAEEARPELIRRALALLNQTGDPELACIYVYHVYRLMGKGEHHLEAGELPDVTTFLATHDRHDYAFYGAME